MFVTTPINDGHVMTKVEKKGDRMPINKVTQVNASVVLEKKIYEKLKKVARTEKRSISAQIGYIIERFLREKEQ